jgi:hypothetical protein
MRRTRYLGVLLLVASLVGATFPAAADDGTAREVQRAYQGPSEISGEGFTIMLGSITVSGEPIAGSVSFQSRPDERRVQFEIADESGADLMGHVEQVWRKRGKDRDDFVGHFCSSRPETFRIRPDARVIVHVNAEACGGEGAPTRGVITARFK